MKNNNDVQKKLAAARTRLILDQPFLGALVLRMPLEAADPSWCATATTDAKKIYYNYEYINELKASETQFILAKQALHCALSHFARRAHRIKHRWDLACEYAVNPMLIDEGLVAPPGTLIEESFTGMTAEEIYPCLQDLEDGELDQDNNQNEGNDESSDPTRNNSENQPDQKQANKFDQKKLSEAQGSGPPPPLSQQELDNLALHRFSGLALLSNLRAFFQEKPNRLRA